MSPTRTLDRHTTTRRRARKPEQSTQVPTGEVAMVDGLLDIQDRHAFLRVDGYLPSPEDVTVPMSLVHRHGLRRGDRLTGGAAGNQLTKVFTVDGDDPDDARRRPDFYKLTPLYPQQRLRLEIPPSDASAAGGRGGSQGDASLTSRVIDLAMPIGKGQRALIISPPKAGKTMVLQALAKSITTNHPEVHLMVVLVDERPEEVTDMRRSVAGEVAAATFDRPPHEHTAVAELAIERAKRLVEKGQDVVVLLDSITRLARAYNLQARSGGRTLSGGLDTTALYPPKQLLGAGRNIENGGSLTIIATALVETGSQMDTVIFEEFKGTGNAELKLDRKIAERRIFPAVDLNATGTRREEILLAPDEMAIVQRLRRALAGSESGQAIEQLLGQLRKTGSNIELLMRLARSNG
ncbi:transcription termination factor Rho [Catenuloplanes nepalensis]|uniref:Transcription termination factor Rho n=1 Tax=Catenuloplanes nepalensis TaxID=587533 RepID=A0ABT9N518_9ACTN|nr:transcription termination factor Rho [Catenuloplanes nepalensis]